jgi:gamma-glutamylcyclotransferase (GGCT)/AIG2-like uncharacterized protein YtfP
MLLFVYGTLQKNFPEHQLLKNSKFISKASIQASLYDLGTEFPAAVRDGSREKTFGEIYDVSPGLISDIDEYEGFDGSEDSLYIRMEVEAILLDRKAQKVWAYIMEEEKLSIFFAFPVKGGAWKG